MSSSSYAIINAKIVTPKDNGRPLAGNAQSNLLTYKHMVIKDGKILKITNELDEINENNIIDMNSSLITPGLIDPHTHLVHGGSREHEIPLKLKGASYMQIHQAGGGIASTVKDTRKMSLRQLKEKAKKDLDHIVSLGVTTIESKSGYGLNFDDEIKCLNVTNELNEESSIDLVSTFMGAHSIPASYKENADDYVCFICDKMIPYVAKNSLAKFCDVFCEEGVFDLRQTEKILLTAKKHGLKMKLHADEIVSIGGAELAAKLEVTSADHLMAISDQGIKDLSKTDVVAVLLPGTSFYLGKNYAPARKIIENGVAVAFATDYNPGSCPSDNIQFIMNLGYLYLKMNPREILNACTINAAYSLDIATETGSLEVGKNADFVVWNSDNLEYIIYRFGKNHVKEVYKNGKKIYEV